MVLSGRFREALATLLPNRWSEWSDEAVFLSGELRAFTI
jgi:hypothetical protein